MILFYTLTEQSPNVLRRRLHDSILQTKAVIPLARNHSRT